MLNLYYSISSNLFFPHRTNTGNNISPSRKMWVYFYLLKSEFSFIVDKKNNKKIMAKWNVSFQDAKPNLNFYLGNIPSSPDGRTATNTEITVPYLGLKIEFRPCTKFQLLIGPQSSHIKSVKNDCKKNHINIVTKFSDFIVSKSEWL